MLKRFYFIASQGDITVKPAEPPKPWWAFPTLNTELSSLLSFVTSKKCAKNKILISCMDIATAVKNVLYILFAARGSGVNAGVKLTN